MALENLMDSFETEQEKSNAKRAQVVNEAMDELLKMLKDNKLDAEQRVEAAKVIEVMSDSMQKFTVLSKVTDESIDNNKKMLKKLDKLDELGK